MTKKGFTLIELLVVIAILAILMSVVVVTINPAEMMKKSRDSKRISDLDALRTAINLYLSEDLSLTSNGMTATYAYISVPIATAGTCGTFGGRTSYCATTANYQKVDGSGWIKLNFNSLTIKSPISLLPVDPTNSTSSGFFYAFGISSDLSQFELDDNMESNYYKNGGPGDVESKDGGNNVNIYEIGSSLTIFN